MSWWWLWATWIHRSGAKTSRKWWKWAGSGLYAPTSSAVTAASKGTGRRRRVSAIRSRSQLVSRASRQPSSRQAASAAADVGEDRPVRQGDGQRAGVVLVQRQR